jgi:hypothetical protein
MEAVAAVISLFALAVSFLSWRAAVQSISASAFDRRFEIYSDAERFIGAWMRDAHPDLGLLPTLVGAWTRSHFLCSDEVTTDLRKLWLDAVNADMDHKVIAGEVQGDRDRAIERRTALMLEHADYERLRAKFMHDLKVATPRYFWRR